MDPVNVQEFEPLARDKLPKPSWDFIAGGAEDEVTLRANRESFQRIQLRPRVLAGVSEVDTSTQVLGQTVPFPVMLAPVALNRLAHPQGELAAARAAAGVGTIMVLSTVSSYPLEDVAQAADGPKWFQLYCYQDRAVTERLVSRAEASGFSALCVTVDVPRLGRREADIRNRLQLPPDVMARNFEQEVDLSNVPTQAKGSAVAAYIATLLHRSLTWDDIDWLRSLTSMRLVIKGIMTAEDARIALDHGVEAIVVSNHGGRQLDGAPAGIDALPEVVDAVDGRAEVLLDGGVRRGTDVLKALALGARAVLIGRPYIWGLAVGGESGVARVLNMLKEELGLAMVLAGRPSLAEVDRGLVAGYATGR